MDRPPFRLTRHRLQTSVFGKGPDHARLVRAFRRLRKAPAPGLLIAEPGVGKSAALRDPGAERPRPDPLMPQSKGPEEALLHRERCRERPLRHGHDTHTSTDSED